MITFTIINLKTKAKSIECFYSMDKARDRLANLETNPKCLSELKKGCYLEAYSYDDDSEKSLIESKLPEDRKMKGDSNG